MVCFREPGMRCLDVAYRCVALLCQVHHKLQGTKSGVEDSGVFELLTSC